MRDERPSAARAGEIRGAIKERYRLVADHAEGHFNYPVGRASALRLGYEAEWIDAAPPGVVAHFVGVGNPFRVERPRPGDRVLDLGCGAGLDVFVAGRLVGPEGRAIGVDITREMLERGRGLAFVQGDLESLPFGDGEFDLVTSNGVLNLVPDKDRAFREIRRVLRPGGTLAAADILLTGTIDPELLADKDAWSTWIAGALPGSSCLAKLREAGFAGAEILGRTGYVTSKYTEAFHIRALAPPAG